MLKRVRDPQKSGVKLTRTDEEVIVTESRWTVISFVGDNGEKYERAEKDGCHTKWFKLV